MSAESNHPKSGTTSDRPSVYSDLRRRNERRLEAALILEDRRRRQIERLLEAPGDSRLRKPRA
jgi:hypothetical protein